MNNPIKHHTPNNQPERVSRKRLTKEQSEHLRESYEERRAILEYEGGYSREEADVLAWLMTYGKQYE